MITQTTPSQCPVLIKARNAEGTKAGTVSIHAFSTSERGLRAAKFLGCCWLLSVVTIILPIAHFVLVPGFFLAGPIGAWILWQRQSVILGGEGSCPSCGNPVSIVRSSDSWPLTDQCAKCRTALVIEKSPTT